MAHDVKVSTQEHPADMSERRKQSVGKVKQAFRRVARRHVRSTPRSGRRCGVQVAATEQYATTRLKADEHPWSNHPVDSLMRCPPVCPRSNFPGVPTAMKPLHGQHE